MLKFNYKTINTKHEGVILPLLCITLSGVLLYSTFVLFQASMAYARAVQYYRVTQKQYHYH